MSAATVLFLLGGLALLAVGGEVLVRGATRLASTFGLSSFVIGLTVVSFATSAPELAVTVQATFSGNPGLAIGNVVGSNIANVLLILGICAIIVPLAVRSQLIRLDIPVMIVWSALVLLLANDRLIDRTDGGLLLGVLVIYLVVVVIVGRRQHWPALNEIGVTAPPAGSAPVSPAVAGASEIATGKNAQAASGASEIAEGEIAAGETALGETARGETTESAGSDANRPQAASPLAAAGLVALGVAMLVGGANLLVSGATDIATALGISDLVIGLSVVAIGTSLPELAASVVALIRGERDLAVGNIVGSCLFNIGAVLGLAAVIAPDAIPVADAAVRLDLPIMIAVALALAPVAFTGFTIARWEGALFVALYVAYIAYVMLDATGHDTVEPFSGAMLGFVIPITALWLVLLVAYEFGLRRGRRDAAR